MHLQIHNHLHILRLQLREDDDLVNAIQELRPECFLERLLNFVVVIARAVVGCGPKAQCAGLAIEFSAKVGSHNQHRVAEIHHAALPVREAAVIEDLQQRIPNFRVRFFDLVEKYHAIGAAAHGFSKLSAVLVAHISGRRPE